MSAAAPQQRIEELEAQLAELQTRLADTEQTLDAIRSGAVDSLVIDGPDGCSIFSLVGAERPYRTLIEQMSEGAVTLGDDGSIRYCNRAFAAMLKRPLETLMGGGIVQHVLAADQAAFASLFHQARNASVHAEIGFRALDSSVVPADVSLNLSRRADSMGQQHRLEGRTQAAG
jgi:PAS domain-containing protein